MNLEASLHSLLSFAWTLTRPTNFNLLRQNIVFSYSERIPVSFSWLFHSFSFFFLLFYVLINFYKNYVVIIIIIIFFFMKIIFIFSCSGMFRNVPACSGMFRVPGFSRRPISIGSELEKISRVYLYSECYSNEIYEISLKKAT